MQFLTWFDLSEVKVINKVKVTLRSRLFQGQIVSVWLSISKRGGGPSTERHSCLSFKPQLAVNRLNTPPPRQFWRKVKLRHRNYLRRILTHQHTTSIQRTNNFCWFSLYKLPNGWNKIIAKYMVGKTQAWSLPWYGSLQVTSQHHWLFPLWSEK